jgi:predicted AlkP superfamily phosphohydrolase/phosphomutase
LKTIEPSISLVVWTSIATGKLPSEHGLTDWEILDEETNKPLLFSSSVRKVEALWTILSQAKRSVGFVNWWATWPAEPVQGFIVSDQFSRRYEGRLEEATFPRKLFSELTEVESTDWHWMRVMLEEGKLKVLTDRGSTDPRPELTPSRLKEAMFLYGHDYRGEQAALHLLSTHARPELVSILLGKIDVASHYMWEFLPPEERDDVTFSRLLEPVYAYEDELLGRLLQYAGSDTQVIVVSDHGFERTQDGYDHKESAPDGIFIASGPAFRSGVELAEVSIYDVAPTVLHVMGLPVGRDFEGEVLNDALSLDRPIAWVDTYETGRRAPRAIRSPIEERIREQLRSLGYIH